jgi:hypothetical protein
MSEQFQARGEPRRRVRLRADDRDRALFRFDDRY